jgi:hypothetical protein
MIRKEGTVPQTSKKQRYKTLAQTTGIKRWGTKGGTNVAALSSVCACVLSAIT